MDPYTIYHVSTFKILPGKRSEAIKWWREKGKAVAESLPGTRSVRAFAVQFGLGPSHYEIWQEIDNYASYDRIDEELETTPEKYAAWGEAEGLIEWGPARIMGDWPESSWSPPELE